MCRARGKKKIVWDVKFRHRCAAPLCSATAGRSTFQSFLSHRKLGWQFCRLLTADPAAPPLSSTQMPAKASQSSGPPLWEGPDSRVSQHISVCRRSSTRVGVTTPDTKGPHRPTQVVTASLGGGRGKTHGWGDPPFSWKAGIGAWMQRPWPAPKGRGQTCVALTRQQVNTLSEPLAAGPGLTHALQAWAEATTDKASRRHPRQPGCLCPFNQGGPGRSCRALRAAAPIAAQDAGRSRTPPSAHARRGRTTAGFLRSLDLETSGRSLKRQEVSFLFLPCAQFALRLGPGAGAADPARPGEPPPASALGTSARPGTSVCKLRTSLSAAVAARSGSRPSIHCFWSVLNTLVVFFSSLDLNRPWCVFFPVFCWIWFAKMLPQVFAHNVRDGPLIFLLVYPWRALVSAFCLPHWMSWGVVPLLTVCRVYQAAVNLFLKICRPRKSAHCESCELSFIWENEDCSLGDSLWR